ncbi:MAG: NADH-quinone oxidoreductase subunit NuoH [Armatimonadota bacterium]|nr:NADH-quinone oxidoreductase subunit NuoH [Armatimonadota bacterium]MDR7455069.1 NADH-quinone oxidoreductase subunit NuoH [Armatimonadota bacterium]MDR7495445.1 NADH-quinone oxidoreductase subunit NuoH [Armatimonadota bacterium]MDR7510872.1 NADH-quinone oxidoreductase subunit NuoH [Armatimonadota bacterium]
MVNWPLEIVRAVLLTAAVFTFMAVVAAMFGVLLERKVGGWIQSRLGPKHVGPQGLLQTVADTIKLLQKEHIEPRAADRAIFNTAPLVVAVAGLMSWVVIPFGTLGDRVLVVRDLNIGVVFFAAMASLTVVGILAGGFASNNKYALLGGLRSASQMISYELPLAMALIAVAMEAGTLSTVGIVEAQAGWFGSFAFRQFPAFVIFLIAATAEVNRVPFDLPEAESELVAGYFSEYTGMRFALFQLGEYGEMFAMAAMATTLFLGGWKGPVLPGVVWFLLKMYLIVFLLMWVRWTYPRYRLDQLLNLSWKVLLPAGLVWILITGYRVTF